MNEYIQEVIEHISVTRKEKLNDAVLGEINQIAKDNEIFTIISLNEKAIVMALCNAIPSKPHIPWDSITKLYSCPACIMSVSESENYCSNCGKRLDWSDCS
jgi:hypothetical protein